MKSPTLLFILFLSACAAPEPVFKPVAVDMPVAAPCKAAMPAKPDLPPPTQTSLFDRTKNLLAELDLRRAYETELESALQSCQ